MIQKICIRVSRKKFKKLLYYLKITDTLSDHKFINEISVVPVEFKRK